MGYLCSALCAWPYFVCFAAGWPSGPFASSGDENERKRMITKLFCKDASINYVMVTKSGYKVALQRVLLFLGVLLLYFFASIAFLFNVRLLSLFFFIPLLSFFMLYFFRESRGIFSRHMS